MPVFSLAPVSLPLSPYKKQTPLTNMHGKPFHGNENWQVASGKVSSTELFSGHTLSPSTTLFHRFGGPPFPIGVPLPPFRFTSFCLAENFLGKALSPNVPRLSSPKLVFFLGCLPEHLVFRELGTGRSSSFACCCPFPKGFRRWAFLMSVACEDTVWDT